MTQERVHIGDHVFLSYRSLEKAFALKLAAELRNSGVMVWVDCLEEGIRAGDDWPQTIEESVNSCRSLIAVVSPDYVASRVCRRELSRADQLGRIIFPVLLKPISTELWPLEIQRIQYVDFTNWQDEISFRKAFVLLFNRLKSEAKEIIGQRPDPEQQYLITLIAEMEALKGISNYISLAAELASRNDQGADNQKEALEQLQPAFDPEFMLLLQSAQGKSSASAPETGSKKIDNISDALKDLKRFVLLGDPGAGKTTALRRLVLEAARARLFIGKSMPLPLLLQLPHWVVERDLVSFIESRWPFQSDLRSAIAAEEVIVFLDGLNEMGGQGVVKAQLIRNWINSTHSSQQLVVTCRLQDYTPSLDLGISEIIVQPMDGSKIRDFATRYLQEGAQAFLTRIEVGKPYIDSRRSLSTLANNPYLLTCLIILFQHSQTRALPGNPGSLFRLLVEYLWSREQIRQTRGWLPFEQAEARFALLGFQMIAEEKPTSVPLQYATEILEGEDILHCGISANILESSGGQVKFYHQLIQEYFAAVQLNKFPSGRLPVPLDKRWYEVVIALAGISGNPEALVLDAADRDPYLAGRCIESGVAVSDATIGRIITELNDEMQSSIWPIRNRQIEMNPGMGSSSIMMMEDALDNYFGTYVGDLNLALRKIESARHSKE